MAKDFNDWTGCPVGVKERMDSDFIKRMSKIAQILFFFLFMGGLSSVRANEPFGGVGIALDQDPQNPQGFVITTVTYKSPADKAKIRRGDRLLKIDGAEVGGLNLPQLAEKIRGPVGSPVALTITGGGGLREVSLLRAQIVGGPVVAVPPPSSSTGATVSSGPVGRSGPQFTPAEKELIKRKILGLKTDQQRETMMNLLKALKEGKIDKPAFLKFLRTDFHDVN